MPWLRLCGGYPVAEGLVAEQRAEGHLALCCGRLLSAAPGLPAAASPAAPGSLYTVAPAAARASRETR
jgi:hypothetical protein